MLNKISYKDFLQIVDDTYNENAFVFRYGQTVMNVLHKIWPEKYKQLMQINYDCFYDDGMVDITLEKLKKEWT